MSFLLPTVNTTAVTNISYTSATTGGEVTNDGGAMILDRGICIGTATNPTIANTKITGGNGTGTFVTSLTNLIPGKKFYVRAYATNEQGTQYGNEINFTVPILPADKIIDTDGNIYNTVVIGTQTWMKENLKTTKYGDGTAIPSVTSNSSWTGLSTPAYCWYDNNSGYKDQYGAYYNWYSVDAPSNGGKNVCPNGYHVPSDADWNILDNQLGGSTIAGTSLKSTTGWCVNGNGTNSSGFNGIPAGARTYDFGSFVAGCGATFWTCTPVDSNYVRCIELNYSYGNILHKVNNRRNGYSIRCVKD